MNRLIVELIRARQAMGLSQVQVAKRMKASRATVCRIETGTHAVTLPILEAYAAALGKRLAIEEA